MSNHVYSREFLRAIPKTDLHVHLDGSLRLSTLIDLGKTCGVELPSFSEAGLKDLVFKDSYANLDEYLSGFRWTTAVMQTKEALHRVAYELAIDNADEGVRYLEVRFAPQLHMSSTLSFDEVMSAVDGGLRDASRDISATDSSLPAFNYGIIVCAMRFFTAEFSPYYATLASGLQFSTLREIQQLAGYELARAAVRLRDNSDIQIVGFDLAGSERGNPAGSHRKAFAHAHENFLHKTVHAGEAYGPESIFQAITMLHADRIGHGLHLFDSDMIENPDIQDRERYVERLANSIAENRTTVEVCLTSNLQTSPDISDIRDHSLSRMLEHGLSVTLCTDNRLVSNTTVTDEIQLAVDSFDISEEQLRNIVIHGFKRSFYYGSYSEKRRYVREIIDYYDATRQDFLRKRR